MTKFSASYLTCDAEEGLPLIFDVNGLSALLGVQLKTMTWLTSTFAEVQDGLGGEVVRDEKKILKLKANQTPIYTTGKRIYRKNGLYRHMQIPKRTPGKVRDLYDPDPRLKYVQRQITECVLNPIMEKIPEYVVGFRGGKSIRDASELHKGREVVICIDIKDFFPSIKQKMILRALGEFGYNDKVAKCISEICTYFNFLPQGAPSSPALSNIVGYCTIDKEVDILANKLGYDYTRYADDLTFSSRKPEFAEREIVDKLIAGATQVCNIYRFWVSEGKTKIMRKHRRQNVLGQVVNNEPKLATEKYMTLKAIVYNTLMNGVEEECAKTNRSPNAFIRWINGHLAYLKQIEPDKQIHLNMMFSAAVELYRTSEVVDTKSVPILE